MKKEERLNNRPHPEPTDINNPGGLNPNGLRARMLDLLRENWEHSDPKYRRFHPNHRYRFRAEELRKMERCVREKEKIAVFRLLDDLGEGKMEIANILHMPYALLEWLILQREQVIRQAEREEEQLAKEEELMDLLSELELI